jgi:putative hydrolase of the HAD superfamily
MTQRKLHPATIFVDADNTLWDTDSVFANAQLELLGNVERASGRQAAAEDRLAFIRSVDQALAERHHAGLRYPPHLLARGIELVLEHGHAADDAARLAWRGRPDYALDQDDVERIEATYFQDIAKQPALRAGVADGLKKLHAAGHTLLVVSEGRKAKIETIAEQLGVLKCFDRVIEGIKSAVLYRRILRLAGMPKRAFMIGDQLDRDIIPAKAAGLETIYFPGGFRPRWSLNTSDTQADHVIETFASVPDIVDDQVDRNHSNLAAGHVRLPEIDLLGRRRAIGHD